MPLYYDVQIGTPGNHTTSGTPNTEVGVYAVLAGASRPVGLQAIYLQGKAAGLSAISGIVIRTMTATTASSSGTACNPVPKRTGGVAAASTAVSVQTISSTGRVNHIITGCGVAGPGGWVAPNDESRITIDGGSGDSIDAISISATASLTFECSLEVVE